SLLKRFVGTSLDGRVIAKTGSIDRVNSLSGYIEPTNSRGRTITFSVQANGHAVPYSQMLAQIDSVVVEIGRTKWGGLVEDGGGRRRRGREDLHEDGGR